MDGDESREKGNSELSREERLKQMAQEIRKEVAERPDNLSAQVAPQWQTEASGDAAADE